MTEKINTTILVSPLDWGLGHATRCIPLVKYLLDIGCKVIIACNAVQEKLLKNELPNVTFILIAGYEVKYTTHKRLLPLKIILQLPKIALSVRRERKWLRMFVKKTPVDCVISDNRYGLYHPGVTSIFITHQLRIKAPFKLAEILMQKINYRLIERFDACWVPDEKGTKNLSGVLSHPAKLPKLPVHYLGGISRLEKQNPDEYEYDLLILLSGPEPQRTLLEKKMLYQLKGFDGKALLVRGLPADPAELPVTDKLNIINHLPAIELATVMNKSEFIISRSGYTTVMDIVKLSKKSILIPTPGQTEQEYLAKHLSKQRWCVITSQDQFILSEVLQQARVFNYQLPDFSMKSYKEVVLSFVQQLANVQQ